MAAFDEARRTLRVSRLAEGATLSDVVGSLLDDIEVVAKEAATLPSRLPDAVVERFRQTIAGLTAAEPVLDADRLHQGAVLIAAKADSEETDQLMAHVTAARELMGKGGHVGHDLNFLTQEFKREANTICSKSEGIALTRIGLRLKDTIDQLREQVQNIV